MKKCILLLMVFMLSFGLLYAQDESSAPKESLEGQGMKFGVGALVAMKSPLLAAGKDGNFAYNDEFQAQFKEISIDDFLFGIPVRLDWVWEKDNGFGIGFQLDLDATYMPTGDYSQLTDALVAKAKSILPSSDPAAEGAQPYDLEHGMRADLTPMFLIQYKIFRFSLGLGMTLDMNISHTADANKAIKGDATAEQTIAEHLNRIGVTDAAIIDKATLKNNLTAVQQMAFYGLGLDMHLKGNLDFMLGKHIVIGGTFLVRMNSEMAKWVQGGDFQTNMNAVFDSNQFEGLLGVRFLWMF